MQKSAKLRDDATDTLIETVKERPIATLADRDRYRLPRGVPLSSELGPGSAQNKAKAGGGSAMSMP